MRVQVVQEVGVWLPSPDYEWASFFGLDEAWTLLVLVGSLDQLSATIWASPELFWSRGGLHQAYVRFAGRAT